MKVKHTGGMGWESAAQSPRAGAARQPLPSLACSLQLHIPVLRNTTGACLLQAAIAFLCHTASTLFFHLFMLTTVTHLGREQFSFTYYSFLFIDRTEL